MLPQARSGLIVLSCLAAMGVLVLGIVALVPPAPPPVTPRPITPADAPFRWGDVREAEPVCLPWTEVIPEGPRWPPNELGQVPILVYHAVADFEDRWTRHHDNFRGDLERLYREGYRLVSLADYVDGRIDIPAGYSPVVITFDDSSSGQFRFIDTPDGPVIDPKSAVGIMVDFHQSHPGFGLEATFFVNFPHPFRDAATWELKLTTLLDLGMDVGNHTWTHAHLGQVSPEEAMRQLALPVDALRRVGGGYEMDILALPFGASSPDISYLLAGEWEGMTYTNRAILLAGGSPAPSSLDRRFDPIKIPRIQAFDQQLDRWLGRFATIPGHVYVSDGCPDRITVPASRADDVDPGAAADREIVVYPD